MAQGPNVQLEDCEPRYEVEQVLHWRTKRSSARKSQKEYLVLWKNYSAKEASWILAENFDDPDHLQEDYYETSPMNKYRNNGVDIF